MATVRRRGKRYQANFYDFAGKRHQQSLGRHIKTERDAQREADALEEEALRNPDDVARESKTFADAIALLEDHLETSVDEGRMPEATAEFHRAKGKVLVRLIGERRPLRAIDPGLTRAYLTARRAGIKHLPTHPLPLDNLGARETRKVRDTTVSKELATLTLVVRLARERGWWSGALGDLRPTGLRQDSRAGDRVLLPSEVDALREQVPAEHWRAYAFALATGAELAAWWRTRRGDIDLKGGFVAVHGTKRRSRERVVPVVMPYARQLLREALNGPDLAPPYLFAKWANVQRALRAACERASMPSCSPNDLRRTYATRHVEAGVPLELLYEAMGHVDLTMLTRNYSRPSPAARARMMREAIGRTKPAPKRSTKTKPKRRR